VTELDAGVIAVIELAELTRVGVPALRPVHAATDPVGPGGAVVTRVPDLSEEVARAQAVWVDPDGGLAAGSEKRADGAGRVV
jgi:hypothetical protein